MKMSSGAIRRRLACLTVLLLVASVGASESQEIGSFFVGVNYAVSGNELQNNFTTYKVDDPGITLGFVLPIFLRTYGLHYKGTVSFNGVEDLEFGSAPAPDDGRFYRNMDTYISSYNALMVGRRFSIGSNAYIHPFFGFGVLVHIIYGNGGEGNAWGSFAFDLSSQFMYKLSSLDLGVQATVAHVAWDGYFNPSSVTYLTLSAVIAK